MQNKSFRAILMLAGTLTLTALACGFGSSEGPPRGATVIDVTANTSLGGWLSDISERFNEAEIETADGNQVYVQLNMADSGQAITEIIDSDVDPALWIPAEKVWVNVLADKGKNNYVDDCESLANSPLVIAMWRPVAEALGWPSLPLGWLDIGSLAADPSAWKYYSGGEYGDSLRLGHTHPGLSGSGASTLLAIVQAAESKSEAVSVEDIQKPIVQASVGAFEAAVSWFSSNTGDLGQTMAERGNQFLGAGVMYESDVVANSNGELVPIYPLEGTFVAEHPACINDQSEAEIQEGASLFREYLLGEEAQQLAVSYGLRPISQSAKLGPPLDPSLGVDLEEPGIVFDSPSIDSLFAVQELWQSARKDVNLVMLLDVSGSMEGDKMEQMRSAAIQFVEQMGDDDLITIIAFSHELPLVVNYQQVGPAREQIIAAIDNLEANGDTALYDAIGIGATVLEQTSTPDTANALVVLTDGQDTYSYRYDFNQDLIDLAAGNGTTVFSIAYGDDADIDILSRLALGANGNFFHGDEASIAAIYDEMSAAFGGNVGVGR